MVIQDDLETKSIAACAIIERWSTISRMSIASNKTKGLVLKGKLMRRYPSITLSGKTVSFTKEILYLGVILDENFTFLPHIKYVGNKAKRLFFKLSRLIRL